MNAEILDRASRAFALLLEDSTGVETLKKRMIGVFNPGLIPKMIEDSSGMASTGGIDP